MPRFRSSLHPCRVAIVPCRASSRLTRRLLLPGIVLSTSAMPDQAVIDQRRACPCDRCRDHERAFGGQVGMHEDHGRGEAGNPGRERPCRQNECAETVCRDLFVDSGRAGRSRSIRSNRKTGVATRTMACDPVKRRPGMARTTGAGAAVADACHDPNMEPRRVVRCAPPAAMSTTLLQGSPLPGPSGSSKSPVGACPMRPFAGCVD